MQQTGTWSARRALEYLLIAALAVMPLLVSIRFRWAQLVIPIAAVPAIALIVVARTDHSALIKQVRKRLRNPSVWLVLLFCLWFAITVAWAPDRAYAASITLRAVGIAFGAAVIYFATTLVVFDRLVRPLLWTWTIAALATIIMMLTDGAIHRRFGCCAGGMQADMTGSAMMLVLLLWPCAGWLFVKHRRKEAIILIALTCFIVSISGSGASGLAIIAGLATVVAGYWRPRIAITIPLGILVSGFVVILVLGNLHSLMNAVAVLDSFTGFHSAERLRIWAAYTDLFWQRPWTGFGPGAERFLNSSVPRDVVVAGAAPDATRLHSHNLALQILVQTGTLGAIIMVTAATIATNQFLRNAAQPPPFATAPLSAYLAAGMVNFGVWEWWWLTLILVAMIFAAGLPSAEKPTAA